MSLVRLSPEEWICDIHATIMAGKSAPSPPPAPDPNAIASAQSAANADAVQKSAEVNQFNQVTPFGSETYTGTIGQPDRTLTTTLNPQAQSIFNQQQGLAGNLTGDAANAEKQVAQVAGTPFSMAGVPAVINPDATNLQQVQDAVYQRNAQYLDPQFANAQHDLDTSLANQGIPVGSDAWQRAQDDLGRQKQQAYSDARDAAIQAGDTVQQQEFGLSQAAHNQGVQDIVTQRTEPMNELAAYLQGAPAIQTPNFASPAQYSVNPADVTSAFGLNQAAQNAAYQGGVAQATAGNSTMAGLLGTAGTVGAMAFF